VKYSRFLQKVQAARERQQEAIRIRKTRIPKAAARTELRPACSLTPAEFEQARLDFLRERYGGGFAATRTRQLVGEHADAGWRDFFET